MDVLKKLKLYDGEDVEGFKQKDVSELRNEFPDEGMSGVDPRYVINRLSSALIRTTTQCINPLDVLRALKDGLEQHASITREEKERLLNFISIARKDIDVTLEIKWTGPIMFALTLFWQCKFKCQGRFDSCRAHHFKNLKPYKSRLTRFIKNKGTG